MNRKFFIISFASICCISASALDITATPGSLVKERIALQTTRDAKVSISGRADASDLAVLSNLSNGVSTLDLRNLEVDALPPRMLMGCHNLTTITLPASLTEIGYYAFSATDIKAIELPATLTIIDDAAFADCTQLAEVSFTGTIAPAFGKNVFSNCAALTKVNGLTSLTAIADGMFDGCSAFTTTPAEFGKVATVGDYAFRGTALKQIDLSSVKSVGKYAFAEIPSLTEVTFDADTRFATGVFFKDSALESITEMNDAPAVAHAHGGGASTLRVVSDKVGEGAYANNASIAKIELSENVKEIGVHAFRNVNALTEIDATALGATVPQVDTTSFSGLENDENRYDVALIIKSEDAGEWETHPVWSLFNIENTITTSIVNVVSDAAISVTRTGDTVSAASSQPIDFFGIYSLDGITLYESRPATAECRTDGIAADTVLIVKIISACKTKLTKLK